MNEMSLTIEPKPQTELADPSALHQPRAVLARLQHAGAGRGAQPEPSAARAPALPVDLGQQSRRILHGARRRPRRPDARRADRAEPGRPDAGRTARPGAQARPGADGRAGHALAAAARRTCARTASRIVDPDELADERPRLARRALSRPHPSGRDADRHRSGASFPLHSQSRLHHRAAAQAPAATAAR